MKLAAFFLILFGATIFASPLEWNHLPDSAEEALTAANEITLYSIRPEVFMALRQKEGFQGHLILGSTVLAEPAIIESVRKLIHGSTEAYDLGDYMCCFEPRHGLRIRTATHTFDFLFCYECTKLLVFADDKLIPPMLGINGTPKLLNGILTERKIPLPPQPSASK